MSGLSEEDIEGGMANLLSDGDNDRVEEIDAVDEVVEDSEEVAEEVIVSEDVSTEESEVVTEFNLDYESFNKKFGTELNAESFEEFINKGKSYGELEGKVSQYETDLASKDDLLSKQFDPLEYFASEEDYLSQQVKKKFPDKDPNVLVKITPSKVEAMSGWDALKNELLVNTPNLEGGEAGADEMLRIKYGIEEDLPMEDWTRAQRNMVAQDSLKAKDSLKELNNDIKVPERVDYKSLQAQNKESWNQPLTDTINGIDEIKLTEDFSFKLTPEMKQGLHEEFINEIASSNKRLSEDTLSEVAGELRSRMLERHLDKVISAVDARAEERVKAEYRKKVHNEQPLNTDTRPDGELSDDDHVRNYLLG